MPHEHTGQLVSMKMSAKDREERFKPTLAADAPIYPFGLSLTLDNDALEKLGMKLPKVGTSLTLYGLVDVTAVSSNESESGKNRSVSLQITDLAPLTEAENSKSAEDTLYES